MVPNSCTNKRFSNQERELFNEDMRGEYKENVSGIESIRCDLIDLI